MRTGLATIGSTAIVLAALAGCSVLLDPEACGSDEDCDEGTCRSGVCLVEPPAESDAAIDADIGPVLDADPSRDASLFDAAPNGVDVEAEGRSDAAPKPDAKPVDDAIPVDDFAVPDILPFPDARIPDAGPEPFVNLPPRCEIVRPAGGGWVNTEHLLVEVEVTDDHTAHDALDVTVDGVEVDLDADGRYVDEMFAMPAAGRATIRLEAHDAHGAGCADRAAVSVDREAPQIEGLPDGPTVRIGAVHDPYVLTLDIVEAGSGVDTLAIEFDGEPLADEAIGRAGDAYVLSLPMFSGLHTLAISVVDRAGNGTDVDLEIEFDDIVPTVEIDDPDDDDVFGVAELEVLATADDDGDLETLTAWLRAVGPGAEDVPWGEPIAPDALGRFSGAVELVAGDNRVEVRIADPHGNEAEASVRVRFDREPPVIEIEAPEINAAVPGEFQMRGIMSRNTASIEVSHQRIATDGTAVAESEPVAAELEPATRRWTATLDLPQPGRYRLFVRGQSIAGRGAEQTTRVVWDDTAPEIAITAPEPGACISELPIAVTGIVVERESSMLSVRVNGEPVPLDPEGRFETETVLPDGQGREVVVEAYNFARRRGRETVNVTVDLTAPRVEITSPEEGSFVTAAGDDGLIAVRGTVVDDGCGLESLSFGEEPVEVLGDAFEYAVALPEGDALIQMLVRDVAGNARIVPLRFIVDNSPPVIANVEPGLAFATNQESVVITADVSDDLSGLVAVRIGESVLDPGPDGRVAFPVAVDPGDNRVPITAIDGVGRETTVILTINRDSVTPMIVVDYPQNDASVEAVVDVLGRAFDGEGGSGVESVRVNGVDAVVDPVTGEWSVVGVSLFPGLNDLSVTASDRAGNVALPTDVRVMVRNFARADRDRLGLFGATETGWLGVTDLDADGRLDIIAMPDEAEGRSGVFLQTGEGAFERVPPAETGIPADVAYRTVAPGDFNNDGTLDLAYGGPGDNGLLRGFGAGIFDEVVGPGIPSVNTVALVAGQSNSDDNNLDLLLIGGAGSTVLIGTGGVGFVRRAVGGIGLAGVAGMTRARMVDLNGDWVLDVVAAGPPGARIFQGMPAQSGSYIELDPEETGFPDAGALDLLVFDADRDGDFDVLRVNAVPRFAINDGTGQNWTTTTLGIGRLTGVTGAAAGDLNGDTRDDVVFYGRDGLSVWISTPQGFMATDSEQSGIPELSEVRTVEIIDIDGDGDLDILAGTKDGIELVRSNATITIDPQRTVSVVVRRGPAGLPGPMDATGVLVRQRFDPATEGYDRIIMMPPAAPLLLTTGPFDGFDVQIGWVDINGPAANRQLRQNVRAGDRLEVDAPEQ